MHPLNRSRILRWILGRSLFLAALLCWAGPALAPAQNPAPNTAKQLDLAATLEGITAQDGDEKLQPLVDAAQARTDPAERGRLYVALVKALGTHLSEPYFQDKVIELSDKALACPLAIGDKLLVYAHKSTALRGRYRHVAGNELKLHRKEMVLPLLLGLRDGAACVRQYGETHADFNPDTPPKPGDKAAYGVWLKQLETYRSVTEIKEDLLGMRRVVAGLYSFAPFSFDELRALGEQTLGNKQDADDLVSQAKSAAAARALAKAKARGQIK